MVATSLSPTPGPFEASFATEQASCPRMVLVEDSGCKRVGSCLAGISPFFLSFFLSYFFFFFLINLISVCFVHCWPFHRKDRTLFLTQFYVAMNSWQGKELVFGWGRKLLTNSSVTHTCGSSQWLVLPL